MAEYLSKKEVQELVNDYIHTELYNGHQESVDTLTKLMEKVSHMYSYRPTIMGRWNIGTTTATCSNCGFNTLAYKNTVYCPECGRMMSNGRSTK